MRRSASSRELDAVSEDAAREQEPARWDSERLLGADEIAELLKVSVRWVRENTRSGLIPSIRLGRFVRYHGPTVRAWVEQQMQGGAAWRKHRPRLSAVEDGGRK